MKKCLLYFVACLIAAGLLASQTSSASTASQNECVFFPRDGKEPLQHLPLVLEYSRRVRSDRGSPSRRRYRRSLEQTARPTPCNTSSVQSFELP